MAGSRIRGIVSRQWELVVALGSRRRGMTMQQLIEELGISRSTIYRDLRDLSAIGVPITAERINGEVRHGLLGDPYPPLLPSPMQVAALHMARRMMSPLAGTRLVQELDRLLRRFSPADSPGGTCGVTPSRAHAIELAAELAADTPPAQPESVARIDQAVTRGKRIRFWYHAVGKSAPSQRRVDPVALRYNRGHLYLIAHDPSRADWRTFKIARLSDVHILDEDADPHPDYDERALFAYSASVWTGAPVDVAVRLGARVARFVHEWPLSANQRIEPQLDDSIVIHARVAGTVEAMRWVLRWGGEAEALQPAALRQAVRDELGAALARYQAHGPSHDPSGDPSGDQSHAS